MNNDIFTKQISSLVDGINNQQVKTTLVMSGDGLHAAVGLVVEDNKLSMVMGSVIVYKLTIDGWKNIQIIEPRNVDIDNHFGFSLAISHDGKRIVVGDNKKYTNSNGYVYIYDYDFVDEEKSRKEYLLTRTIWNKNYSEVIGSNISMSSIGGYIYDGYDTIHILDESTECKLTIDVSLSADSDTVKPSSVKKINTGITAAELEHNNIVIANNNYSFLLYGMYVRDEKQHYFTQIHRINIDGSSELVSSKIIDNINGYTITGIYAGTISDNGDNVAITYKITNDGMDTYLTYIFNNVLKAKPKSKFLNKSECFILKYDFQPSSICFNKTNDKFIIGRTIDITSALNTDIIMSRLVILMKEKDSFKFTEINDKEISGWSKSLLHTAFDKFMTTIEKENK